MEKLECRKECFERNIKNSEGLRLKLKGNLKGLKATLQPYFTIYLSITLKSEGMKAFFIQTLSITMQLMGRILFLRGV